MIEKLNNIQIQAEEKIKNCNNLEDLLTIEKEFLGKKGSLQEILKGIKDLDPKQKGEVGKLSNQIKHVLLSLIEAQKITIEKKLIEDKIQNESFDVTLPGIEPKKGSIHVLKQVQKKLENVFLNLGFNIADGPEVESEKYNFVFSNQYQIHKIEYYYLDRLFQH